MEQAAFLLQERLARLCGPQAKLNAQGWAVLLIYQGMDTAGKDSVIKRVMSGVYPQGCELHPFKEPSDEELNHDFLWRAARSAPGSGFSTALSMGKS
jgi:polyphosphate kinase 2 (PPK2 family)